MAKLLYDNREEMIECFRQRKEGYFDIIFIELYPALCIFSMSLVSDRLVAEDIVEESFIKVWIRRDGFDHYLSLKSFLYTTTRNACLDYLRRQKSRVKANDALKTILVPSEKNVLENLIKCETYRELHQAISQLPSKCSKVINMTYLQGKSGAEVATLLHINIGTVKSHKARGLELLRKRLGIFPVTNNQSQ